MGALVLVPPADPTVYGPPVLPIGARVEIMGSEYKLIRFTGHQMVYERHDKLETLPLSWNQYIHIWNTVGLRVIPSLGQMTEAKTRLSDEITYAIKATGLAGVGLSPARLHRSLSGNAMKAGQGCKVAAVAGGYRVMPFSKPVAVSAEEISDLIELHHPMSRMPLT